MYYYQSFNSKLIHFRWPDCLKLLYFVKVTYCNICLTHCFLLLTSSFTVFFKCTTHTYSTCKQTHTRAHVSCTEWINAETEIIKANKKKMYHARWSAQSCSWSSYSTNFVMPRVIECLHSAALFFICIRSLPVKSTVTCRDFVFFITELIRRNDSSSSSSSSRAFIAHTAWQKSCVVSVECLGRPKENMQNCDLSSEGSYQHERQYTG